MSPEPSVNETSDTTLPEASNFKRSSAKKSPPLRESKVDLMLLAVFDVKTIVARAVNTFLL